MVVQHNLRAMNSNRMLGITTGTQAKSTEKLSSGYKINRAADDAAGLSISEKMRKQIRGLTQASLNAEDGISAVQTAEGALNEVQDMLQRMNELAVKAANGTMSENDRSYIQNEIDQLETEIDRVSETTKFNETYLLKGDPNGVKDAKYTYADKSDYLAEGKKLYTKNEADGTEADYVETAAVVKENQELYVNDNGVYKEVAAGKLTAATAEQVGAYVEKGEAETGALKLALHVGTDATDNNQIAISIEAMSAESLGVKDIKVDGTDDTNARNAIDTIKEAIQKVSTQRSALGAVQNRLEHTIANLDKVVENTTAAESQIRDTDMATEMVKFSNNNILAQAGQAMLAQAN